MISMTTIWDLDNGQNDIRCHHCGSIDPILYTNRLICCDGLSIVAEKRPAAKQYQFSSRTGKLGLFCRRGCCDFSQKFERHYCSS